MGIVRAMKATLVLAAAVGALTLAACGGSSGEAVPVDASLNVVAPGGFKYDKDSYTLPAGPQTIALLNKDSQAHNIKIKDVDGVNIQAGGKSSKVGNVDLTAGTYTIYCSIPGHEAGGMKAELAVG
jgi:plastocyanin